MKKPSSVFASNHEYVLKPFALQNHEHANYFQLDSTSPVEVDSPVIFNGPVYGIPGLTDPIGVTDGFVLTASGDLAVWAASTGGAVGADYHIDGGFAGSIYTSEQHLNGGGA